MKKIILVAFSFILLSGCSNSSATTIAAQEKCTIQAKKVFDDLEKTDFKLSASYTNHYNTKLDKCFLLTSGYLTIHQSRNELRNAFENTVIASCTYYLPPDGAIQPFCDYPGSNGEYNLDKFKNFTKSYMEE